METEWIKAVQPKPWRVAGVLLREFSLGHALLLQRAGSPFLCGDQYPKPGDLAMAIAICSVPYAEARAMLRGETSAWRLKWWGWQFRLQQIWRPGRWVVAVEAFKAYLAEATQPPNMWRKEAEGEELITPGLLGVQVSLMMHLHQDGERIWETGYGAAMWQLSALSAIKGVAQFVTEEQMEEREMIKAAQEAAARGS